MKVLKFGGSSVGNAENIERVVEIIVKTISTDSCAVVLSAMQGTTDALINIGHAAENGDESFRNELESIAQKHLETADALIDTDAQSNIINFINKRIAESKNTTARGGGFVFSP